MSSQNSDRELVIIGGARGVGKSTLSKMYCSHQGASYHNPGDWFEKYLYKVDSTFIEGIVTHDVLSSPKPVVDMHFATYVKPWGFRRGFCDDSLKMLSEYFGTICLYLVEVDAQKLYDRRVADVSKKRKLDIDIIREELNQNAQAFEHFVKVLSKKSVVHARKIVNSDLEDTLNELIKK